MARTRGRKVRSLDHAVKQIIKEEDISQEGWAGELNINVKTFRDNYLSPDGALCKHWRGLKTIMEKCGDEAPLQFMAEELGFTLVKIEKPEEKVLAGSDTDRRHPINP